MRARADKLGANDYPSVGCRLDPCRRNQRRPRKTSIGDQICIYFQVVGLPNGLILGDSEVEQLRCYLCRAKGRANPGRHRQMTSISTNFMVKVASAAKEPTGGLCRISTTQRSCGFATKIGVERLASETSNLEAFGSAAPNGIRSNSGLFKLWILIRME